MSKPKVHADELGNIINYSNNPDYGYIRVIQRRAFIEKSWIKIKNLSALIHGTIQELEEMQFKDQQELPGKIVIQESLEPFNEKDPDRDLKIAGDTNIVCEFHGSPIYRRVIYTEDSTQCDIIVQHTNSKSIKNRLKIMNEEVGKVLNDDFKNE